MFKKFILTAAAVMASAVAFAQGASSLLANGESKAVIMGTYQSQGQNLPVLAAFQGQSYQLLLGVKSENEQCFIVFPDRFRTGVVANLLKMKKLYLDNKQAAINAYSVNEDKNLASAGITFPPVASVRWTLLGNLYTAQPANPNLEPHFVVAMDAAGNVSYSIKMEGDAHSADYVSEHWTLTLASEEEIDRLIEVLKNDPSSRYSLEDLDLVANGVPFKMIAVQGGTFTMGATPEQGGDAEPRELPAHSVTVSDFYIGETEVTQALYQAVMGVNPSGVKNPMQPVERVTWQECVNFVNVLSSLTGKTFRLPTEAEWEYAARGGNKSKNFKYAGGFSATAVGWIDANAGGATHMVKTTVPNELGIYDMCGNVWEWCHDWYSSAYTGGSQENPQGAYSGTERVRRGGSWRRDAKHARVSFRGHYDPNERSSNLAF